MTDEVGWFSDHYVCALLPDTTVRGAKSFSDGICEMAPRKGPRPVAVIYGYPGNWVQASLETPAVTTSNLPDTDRFRDQDDDGNDDAGSPGGGRLNGNSISVGNGNGHSVSAARTLDQGMTRADLLPAFTQGMVAASDESGMPAGSISDLLVHPMPLWKRGLDIVARLDDADHPLAGHGDLRHRHQTAPAPAPSSSSRSEPASAESRS